MTYLAFIVATGLYVSLGPGGPLHHDRWFRSLQQRVDALEPDFWLGFVLLVAVPCALFGLIYIIAADLFGGAAMLLLGTAALFFAFGRTDFPTLMQRFLGRCRAGDHSGASLILESLAGDAEAESAETFGRIAGRLLGYEGFQRWFPAAFYFVLLGPIGAVTYRLIQLSSKDRSVPVGSLRHLVDWLPSRLLLITFALAGNFDQTRSLVADLALDPDVETDELLMQGIEAAFVADAEDPVAQAEAVDRALKRATVIWVVVISLVAMLLS